MSMSTERYEERGVAFEEEQEIMTKRFARRFWRTMLVGLAVASVLGDLACSKNPTAVSRELAARPRVEQLALSTAMEDAYGDVDFGFVKDKSVYVETKALAKTDVVFITSFVQKQVMAAGGIPALNEEDAELKLTSTVEVSGTDEVKRALGKDVVMGQFKGSLAVIDLTSGTIVKMFDLDALAQTTRSRKAKTKSVEQ